MSNAIPKWSGVKYCTTDAYTLWSHFAHAGGGDGDSTCYKQYNTLGSVLGNCGRSRGVFTSCSERQLFF